MPLDSREQQEILQYITDQHLRIKSQTGWQNFSRNFKLPNVLVLDVDDVASLQSVIKKIYDINNQKSASERIIVRAAAGGATLKGSESYSFTEGIASDVIVRLAGNDFQTIQKTSSTNIMQVGASVQIGTLNQTLYDQHDLVLPTASLIPYVTVAGLAANAGHGTGKDQPSFAGLIQAMTFCLPNGELIRIDKNHPDFEVIRAAHLGLFGILVDVELTCMPAKKLQCIVEARSVPEFLAEVQNGLFFNDPYVSVMYVPTYQKDELTNKKLKNVLIYRWRPVDKQVHDVNNHPQLAQLGQLLEIKMHEAFHVNDLLRLVPSIIPYYMTYLVTRAAIGTKDSLAVAPWPSYHYQKTFPHDINDTDSLFEVSPDSHEIVEAFTHLVTTLGKYAKSKRYPVNYAAYLRLFAGTNGGLSSSQHADNRAVCAFDIVSSPGLYGYEPFREEMNAYFNTQFHAKPHWGKYVDRNLDYEKLYGAHYSKFITTLQSWYEKNGLKLENSMLLNGFFAQILKLPYAPNETLARDLTLNKHVETNVNVEELAKKLLAAINDENDPAALNLKRKLCTLAYTNRVPSNQGLFQTARTGAEVLEHETKDFKM